MLILQGGFHVVLQQPGPGAHLWSLSTCVVWRRVGAYRRHVHKLSPPRVSGLRFLSTLKFLAGQWVMAGVVRLALGCTCQARLLKTPQTICSWSLGSEVWGTGSQEGHAIPQL
ncbi:hypothetical protein E2C01_087043 [Portunus trituberculatus]|uniref:Uncharacterized protein n=1 Tax=Portunus trituberculatus TaxID=210409 RepID=A0A5B7JD08_PORTR|nr:hypothetical protein [Portunus trituberculatus]